MKTQVIYTSQSRLDFDMDNLLEMGIQAAYVVPFSANNECLSEPEITLANLEILADRAQIAAEKGLQVYPFFITINHPDGNYEVPSRYRQQRNLDGSERLGFICFLDQIRRQEMIDLAVKAASLGFERMAFDDDLRDAFCYCDEHLAGFAGFRGRSREELAVILNGILSHPEYEELRKAWYEYKYNGMCDFARALTRAVHAINPACRIGLCNSAKRCQDFSGRDPWRWAEQFHTDKAPTFIRLCGECYNDNLLSLAQSVGWHFYFDQVFPDTIEKKLELTSVPDIGYRSCGGVLFEAHTVVEVTGRNRIHWAWTGDFNTTGLQHCVGPAKRDFAALLERTSGPLRADLVQYIGAELGPYLPSDIVIPYGAVHDPITTFNIVSLAGIPILPIPHIPDNQPAIICSSYISRSMIERFDEYVVAGGVGILDATAAHCYGRYGGTLSFSVRGPASRHRYELGPDDTRENMCKDCKPDIIYLIEGCRGAQAWNGYDIDDNCTGMTTAILSHGKGKLIFFGYDLTLTGSRMIRPELRERFIKMLSCAQVMPRTYWAGPVAVQCFDFGYKVLLINYNTHAVTGDLMINNNSRTITIEPFTRKQVDVFW